MSKEQGDATTPMPDELTLNALQQHINARYGDVDRARGWPTTFAYFIEEVGELATALTGDDAANRREEFADVLAWLCTLANVADIDLATAVRDKYLDGEGPQGHK